MSMGKPSGISRGDRRRNARLVRLRGIVRRDRAVLAIDLADDTQVVAVCDHDSAVLAKRTWRCRPWQLDQALAWGHTVALEGGFAGVVVACEPTGHRWRVVAELCDQAGLELVCVQPLLVARAREAEDYTADKSDPKDALLIARLTAELRCYLPERPDATWARLRHLGARRARLITQVGAARQQLRDLLECAHPGLLEVAAQPLDSLTWRAAVTVALGHLDRAGGDPTTLGRHGYARFARQVSVELGRWGGRRRCHRILRAVWTTVGDPAPLGVAAQRRGGLERARLVLGDWHHTLGLLDDVGQRMTGLLDQLQLVELVGSIPGLSVVGAAQILAETGDPVRFDTARCLVKHAGLCPRDNASGAYQGKTTISGRGRPGLRLAAWRAVWGALPHNPVLAARYAQLTGRDRNQLSDRQARVALAASLLRWLWAVITTRTSWDAATASGTINPHKEVTAPAA
jgi:transposase